VCHVPKHMKQNRHVAAQHIVPEEACYSMLGEVQSIMLVEDPPEASARSLVLPEMQDSESEAKRPQKRRSASMCIGREAAQEAIKLSGMAADHCRYCRWLHKAAEVDAEEASSICEPCQQRTPGMIISREDAQEAIKQSGLPADHCRYCQWLHAAAEGDAEGSSSWERGHKWGWLSFMPRLEWPLKKRRRLA